MTGRLARWLVGLLAALVLLLAARAILRSPAPAMPCPAMPVAAASGEGSATRLAELLEYVPCGSGSQAAYDLRDNHGAGMGVLDPIADPAGGYLGVYHTIATGSPPGTASAYQVVLAHSEDLIHWTRVRTLDPYGASMPTLQPVPGARGYLLAYEKWVPPSGAYNQWTGSPGQSTIRVTYFATRADMVADQPTATIDLPRRYSSSANGTPAFLSIDWRGGLSRSTIELGFHYQLDGSTTQGADREAHGWLTGFRRWITVRDSAVDQAIDRLGLTGSHGDERQFQYGARAWRVYEASSEVDRFGSWHIVLYSPFTGQVLPLQFHMPYGTFGASFGNPTVRVLPAPRGSGAREAGRPSPDPRQVLAVTVFVFSAGPAAHQAGELLFYRLL